MSGVDGSAMRSIRSRAASTPISRFGSWIVVMGGEVRLIIGMSLKPTSETS